MFSMTSSQRARPSTTTSAQSAKPQHRSSSVMGHASTSSASASAGAIKRPHSTEPSSRNTATAGGSGGGFTRGASSAGVGGGGSQLRPLPLQHSGNGGASASSSSKLPASYLPSPTLPSMMHRQTQQKGPAAVTYTTPIGAASLYSASATGGTMASSAPASGTANSGSHLRSLLERNHSPSLNMTNRYDRPEGYGIVDASYRRAMLKTGIAGTAASHEHLMDRHAVARDAVVSHQEREGGGLSNSTKTKINGGQRPPLLTPTAHLQSQQREIRAGKSVATAFTLPAPTQRDESVASPDAAVDGGQSNHQQQLPSISLAVNRPSFLFEMGDSKVKATIKAAEKGWRRDSDQQERDIGNDKEGANNNHATALSSSASSSETSSSSYHSAIRFRPHRRHGGHSSANHSDLSSIHSSSPAARGRGGVTGRHDTNPSTAAQKTSLNVTPTLRLGPQQQPLTAENLRLLDPVLRHWDMMAAKEAIRQFEIRKNNFRKNLHQRQSEASGLTIDDVEAAAKSVVWDHQIRDQSALLKVSDEEKYCEELLEKALVELTVGRRQTNQQQQKEDRRVGSANGREKHSMIRRSVLDELNATAGGGHKPSQFVRSFSNNKRSSDAGSSSDDGGGGGGESPFASGGLPPPTAGGGALKRHTMRPPSGRSDYMFATMDNGAMMANDSFTGGTIGGEVLAGIASANNSRPATATDQQNNNTSNTTSGRVIRGVSGNIVGPATNVSSPLTVTPAAAAAAAAVSNPKVPSIATLAEYLMLATAKKTFHTSTLAEAAEVVANGGSLVMTPRKMMNDHSAAASPSRLDQLLGTVYSAPTIANAYAKVRGDNYKAVNMAEVRNRKHAHVEYLATVRLLHPTIAKHKKGREGLTQRRRMGELRRNNDDDDDGGEHTVGVGAGRSPTMMNQNTAGGLALTPRTAAKLSRKKNRHKSQRRLHQAMLGGGGDGGGRGAMLSAVENDEEVPAMASRMYISRYFSFEFLPEWLDGCCANYATVRLRKKREQQQQQRRSILGQSSTGASNGFGNSMLDVNNNSFSQRRKLSTATNEGAGGDDDGAEGSSYRQFRFGGASSANGGSFRAFGGGSASGGSFSRGGDHTSSDEDSDGNLKPPKIFNIGFGKFPRHCGPFLHKNKRARTAVDEALREANPENRNLHKSEAVARLKVLREAAGRLKRRFAAGSTATTPAVGLNGTVSGASGASEKNAQRRKVASKSSNTSAAVIAPPDSALAAAAGGDGGAPFSSPPPQLLLAQYCSTQLDADLDFESDSSCSSYTSDEDRARKRRARRQREVRRQNRKIVLGDAYESEEDSCSDDSALEDDDAEEDSGRVEDANDPTAPGVVIDKRQTIAHEKALATAAALAMMGRGPTTPLPPAPFKGWPFETLENESLRADRQEKRQLLRGEKVSRLEDFVRRAKLLEEAEEAAAKEAVRSQQQQMQRLANKNATESSEADAPQMQIQITHSADEHHPSPSTPSSSFAVAAVGLAENPGKSSQRPSLLLNAEDLSTPSSFFNPLQRNRSPSRDGGIGGSNTNNGFRSPWGAAAAAANVSSASANPLAVPSAGGVITPTSSISSKQRHPASSSSAAVTPKVVGFGAFANSAATTPSSATAFILGPDSASAPPMSAKAAARRATMAGRRRSVVKPMNISAPQTAAELQKALAHITDQPALVVQIGVGGLGGGVGSAADLFGPILPTEEFEDAVGRERGEPMGDNMDAIGAFVRGEGEKKKDDGADSEDGRDRAAVNVFGDLVDEVPLLAAERMAITGAADQQQQKQSTTISEVVGIPVISIDIAPSSSDDLLLLPQQQQQPVEGSAIDTAAILAAQQQQQQTVPNGQTSSVSSSVATASSEPSHLRHRMLHSTLTSSEQSELVARLRDGLGIARASAPVTTDQHRRRSSSSNSFGNHQHRSNSLPNQQQQNNNYNLPTTPPFAPSSGSGGNHGKSRNDSVSLSQQMQSLLLNPSSPLGNNADGTQQQKHLPPSQVVSLPLSYTNTTIGVEADGGAVFSNPLMRTANARDAIAELPIQPIYRNWNGEYNALLDKMEPSPLNCATVKAEAVVRMYAAVVSLANEFQTVATTFVHEALLTVLLVHGHCEHNGITYTLQTIPLMECAVDNSNFDAIVARKLNGDAGDDSDDDAAAGSDGGVEGDASTATQPAGGKKPWSASVSGSAATGNTKGQQTAGSPNGIGSNNKNKIEKKNDVEVDPMSAEVDADCSLVAAEYTRKIISNERKAFSAINDRWWRLQHPALGCDESFNPFTAPFPLRPELPRERLNVMLAIYRASVRKAQRGAAAKNRNRKKSNNGQRRGSHSGLGADLEVVGEENEYEDEEEDPEVAALQYAAHIATTLAYHDEGSMTAAAIHSRQQLLGTTMANGLPLYSHMEADMNAGLASATTDDGANASSTASPSLPIGPKGLPLYMKPLPRVRVPLTCSVNYLGHMVTCTATIVKDPSAMEPAKEAPEGFTKGVADELNLVPHTLVRDEKGYALAAAGGAGVGAPPAAFAMLMGAKKPPLASAAALAIGAASTTMNSTTTTTTTAAMQLPFIDPRKAIPSHLSLSSVETRLQRFYCSASLLFGTVLAFSNVPDCGLIPPEVAGRPPHHTYLLSAATLLPALPPTAGFSKWSRMRPEFFENYPDGVSADAFTAAHHKRRLLESIYNNNDEQQMGQAQGGQVGRTNSTQRGGGSIVGAGAAHRTGSMVSRSDSNASANTIVAASIDYVYIGQDKAQLGHVKAARRLVHKGVSDVVDFVEALGRPLQHCELCELCHQRGLNLSMLGRVADLLSSRINMYREKLATVAKDLDVDATTRRMGCLVGTLLVCKEEMCLRAFKAYWLQIMRQEGRMVQRALELEEQEEVGFVMLKQNVAPPMTTTTAAAPLPGKASNNVVTVPPSAASRVGSVASPSLGGIMGGAAAGNNDPSQGGIRGRQRSVAWAPNEVTLGSSPQQQQLRTVSASSSSTRPVSPQSTRLVGGVGRPVSPSGRVGGGASAQQLHHTSSAALASVAALANRSAADALLEHTKLLFKGRVKSALTLKTMTPQHGVTLDDDDSALVVAENVMRSQIGCGAQRSVPIAEAAFEKLVENRRTYRANQLAEAEAIRAAIAAHYEEQNGGSSAVSRTLSSPKHRGISPRGGGGGVSPPSSSHHHREMPMIGAKPVVSPSTSALASPLPNYQRPPTADGYGGGGGSSSSGGRSGGRNDAPSLKPPQMTAKSLQEDYAYHMQCLSTLLVKTLFGKETDSKVAYLWHNFIIPILRAKFKFGGHIGRSEVKIRTSLVRLQQLTGLCVSEATERDLLDDWQRSVRSRKRQRAKKAAGAVGSSAMRRPSSAYTTTYSAEGAAGVGGREALIMHDGADGVAFSDGGVPMQIHGVKGEDGEGRGGEPMPNGDLQISDVEEASLVGYRRRRASSTTAGGPKRGSAFGASTASSAAAAANTNSGAAPRGGGGHGAPLGGVNAIEDEFSDEDEDDDTGANGEGEDEAALMAGYYSEGQGDEAGGAAATSTSSSSAAVGKKAKLRVSLGSSAAAGGGGNGKAKLSVNVGDGNSVGQGAFGKPSADKARAVLNRTCRATRACVVGTVTQMGPIVKMPRLPSLPPLWCFLDPNSNTRVMLDAILSNSNKVQDFESGLTDPLAYHKGLLHTESTASSNADGDDAAGANGKRRSTDAAKAAVSKLVATIAFKNALSPSAGGDEDILSPRALIKHASQKAKRAASSSGGAGSPMKTALLAAKKGSSVVASPASATTAPASDKANTSAAVIGPYQAEHCDCALRPTASSFLTAQGSGVSHFLRAVTDDSMPLTVRLKDATQSEFLRRIGLPDGESSSIAWLLHNTLEAPPTSTMPRKRLLSVPLSSPTSLLTITSAIAAVLRSIGDRHFNDCENILLKIVLRGQLSRVVADVGVKELLGACLCLGLLYWVERRFPDAKRTIQEAIAAERAYLSGGGDGESDRLLFSGEGIENNVVSSSMALTTTAANTSAAAGSNSGGGAGGRLILKVSDVEALEAMDYNGPIRVNANTTAAALKLALMGRAERRKFLEEMLGTTMAGSTAQQRMAMMGGGSMRMGPLNRMGSSSNLKGGGQSSPFASPARVGRARSGSISMNTAANRPKRAAAGGGGGILTGGGSSGAGRPSFDLGGHTDAFSPSPKRRASLVESEEEGERSQSPSAAGGRILPSSKAITTGGFGANQHPSPLRTANQTTAPPPAVISRRASLQVQQQQQMTVPPPPSNPYQHLFLSPAKQQALLLSATSSSSGRGMLSSSLRMVTMFGVLGLSELGDANQQSAIDALETTALLLIAQLEELRGAKHERLSQFFLRAWPKMGQENYLMEAPPAADADGAVAGTTMPSSPRGGAGAVGGGGGFGLAPTRSNLQSVMGDSRGALNAPPTAPLNGTTTFLTSVATMQRSPSNVSAIHTARKTASFRRDGGGPTAAAARRPAPSYTQNFDFDSDDDGVTFGSEQLNSTQRNATANNFNSTAYFGGTTTFADRNAEAQQKLREKRLREEKAHRAHIAAVADYDIHQRVELLQKVLLTLVTAYQPQIGDVLFAHVPTNQHHNSSYVSSPSNRPNSAGNSAAAAVGAVTLTGYSLGVANCMLACRDVHSIAAYPKLLDGSGGATVVVGRAQTDIDTACDALDGLAMSSGGSGGAADDTSSSGVANTTSSTPSSSSLTISTPAILFIKYLHFVARHVLMASGNVATAMTLYRRALHVASVLREAIHVWELKHMCGEVGGGGRRSSSSASNGVGGGDGLFGGSGNGEEGAMPANSRGASPSPPPPLSPLSRARGDSLAAGSEADAQLEAKDAEETRQRVVQLKRLVIVLIQRLTNTVDALKVAQMNISNN